MSSVKFVINPSGNCRLCKELDEMDDMVSCDECMAWFHFGCVGIVEKPTRKEQWICAKCSERAALAKKVAELSEALSKSSIDNPQKDIKPIASTSPTVVDDGLIVYLKRQALVQLPTFSGSARDWPKFKQIYDHTTREGKFDDVQNFSRLISVLQGPAAKCVQHLMLNPINVSKIMKRLEENYGNPEVIYRKLVSNIQKTKKKRTEPLCARNIGSAGKSSK